MSRGKQKANIFAALRTTEISVGIPYGINAGNFRRIDGLLIAHCILSCLTRYISLRGIHQNTGWSNTRYGIEEREADCE